MPPGQCRAVLMETPLIINFNIVRHVKQPSIRQMISREVCPGGIPVQVGWVEKFRTVYTLGQSKNENTFLFTEFFPLYHINENIKILSKNKEDIDLLVIVVFDNLLVQGKFLQQWQLLYIIIDD